jgi:hypothetical protein
MLMLEVQTHILNVLCEGGLFLNEKIGVLSHPLIGLLVSASLSPVYNSFSFQLDVLEVLIGLLEIQKLRFYVKACH